MNPTVAIIRLAVLILAVEILFYVLISIYVRSTRREALEKTWDRRHPDHAGDNPWRREFVRRAMIGFSRTLRARLVGLVLILPFVAIMVIIWLVNHR